MPKFGLSHQDYLVEPFYVNKFT